MRKPVVLDELLQHLGIVGRDPARERELGGVPQHFEAVFVLEPHAQHVELQRADHADQRRRAVLRAEHLHDALLRELLQRLLQLLRLHGVGQPHAAQDFRREVRHADEIDVLALGQRVADRHRAVVGDADHVAGIGLVGDRAVLREEELRRVERDRLAGADLLDLHAAGELARAQPRERDAVAVVRVHVGLDLEHEGRHVRLVGLDGALVGLLRARRRRHAADGVEQIADAEVLQRRAEEHRAQMALAEGLQVERLAGVANQRELAFDRSGIEIGVERRDIG